MKQLFAVVITCFFIQFNSAQSVYLSDKAEISILTFGPGKNLNDAFGHNAFRIKDVLQNIDIVYGYGGYDFDTPYFYLKFIQGKLNYHVSKNRYKDIYHDYSTVNRSIKEQQLNLNKEEKLKLYQYLVNNFKPENSAYLYDFFFDNCATKIRDISTDIVNAKINFNPKKDFKTKTFRTLIHDYVGLNTWGSFGIDIALGSTIDQNATLYDHMFLPDYIHTLFGNATKQNGEPLVKQSRTIYKKRAITESPLFITSPLFIMSLLSILIIYITFKDYTSQKRSQWLDVSIAIITSLAGCILLFLWFGTNHEATGYNYNLLWAFPLNIILIKQILKHQPKTWLKGYFKFLILMLCLMLLHWTIGVQIFSIALIPIIIALVVRYAYILHTFATNNNN